MRSLAAVGLVALVGCGRIGFAIGAGSDTTGDDSDASGIPPAPHTMADSIVDAAGVTTTGYEADGTHLVFTDTTPGENGNLVIFREGDGASTFRAYVSTDGGVAWTRYVLAPGNSFGLNAMGACQDSVDHLFHLIWLDTGAGDQYARWQPVYTGGDITGFTLVAAYSFFDDGGDTPGPRDIAEVVDAGGNHRLLFAGTGPASGSTGLYKLAVTTVAAGLAPASQNDWAKATDQTKLGLDDQLLPNNFTTGDSPTSYMLSVSSSVVAQTTVVVAGLPVDKKLLAWTITPIAGNNFSVSAAQTLSTSFGAGALRSDASLSLATAPSGDAWIVYGEAGGLHVTTLTPSGALVAESPPSTSAQARHAVIATDSASRPAILYSDGTNGIWGTLLWESAWLAPTMVSPTSSPSGAWSISNVWRRDGQDRFGIYRDAGAAMPTTFSQVYWR